MSGNDVLLKARQHWRAHRTHESLRKVSVPDWGTEVFYYPEMSVAERLAVFAHMKAGKTGLEITPSALLAAAVTQVCLRARDAMGERLFTDDQEPDLYDTHPDVLQRIANEMGWGSSQTLEQAEGN
jgi:hypothetical protein